MEKVRLGRTGLVVTKMGWGGIPIQRVGEAEAISVIREVVGMGVDLLDSARGYTSSEGRIGLALEGFGKPVVLSTKSHAKTAAIYDDVRESLRQLRVKKIDIYHMHLVVGIGDYERVMAPGGAYEGLSRARDEGLIDHIGLSSHNLDVLARAVLDGIVSVIMACYSFLEPDAAKRVFPLARERDIGIIAMKPFSGGVIEDAGCALRYVLATEGIAPIPGVETVEKARENWKVFSEGGGLTERDRQVVEAVRKEYDQRFCRRCDYCQPCTEGIAIQMVLGLKGMMKRLGSQLGQVEQIKVNVEKARSCSECGECLKRCPYGLPIPDLIKENIALYDRPMAG